MHVLDSRRIGPLNTYTQKVPGSGELMLDVQPASGGFLPFEEDKAKKAKVKSRPAARRRDRKGGKQHYVPLASNKDNVFSMKAEDMDVEEGDALTFHLPGRKERPCVVRGQIGDFRFSSLALRHEAVFTHPFGVAGRYEWADANGSKVGGVITVRDDPADGKLGAERAMDRMKEGVLVHIVGDKVSPREVTISTGQTVFFAVEDTDGITITDVTLLKR